ncbi:MAG: diaminopimelate decarboxylase [Clostridia bacterium]|nr:diaminopimelate decarboxylase [Clostridia bacterium]
MEKRPFVTKEQIEEIAKTYPTPFHLYDEKGLRENAERVKRAFAWNPGYQEFFAVKACPNPVIVGILAEYGFGCDCASLAELAFAKAIGLPGDKIMFTSNVTPAEEFQYAASIGAIINFDDISHIDYCERAIGQLPETVSIRYNPGGSFTINTAIMDNPGEAKYGFTTPQMYEGMRRLKEKGIKHCGIHAFLASNTVTNDYYPTLAKELFELAVDLHEKTGMDIPFVNLSGGVGIAYRPDQTPNDIEVIGARVHQVYDEVFGPAGMQGVKVFTEMGRFITGPYDLLIGKVLHIKHTHKEFVGLDACCVDLMRPAMYGAYHHATVLGKEDEPATYRCDITGSLCESNDRFAIDRLLPPIEVGDYIAIHDAGAHGHSMGSNYNGKLRHAELLLKTDGSVQLIRRAETLADYFKTLEGTEFYSRLDL